MRREADGTDMGFNGFIERGDIGCRGLEIARFHFDTVAVTVGFHQDGCALIGEAVVANSKVRIGVLGLPETQRAHFGQGLDIQLTYYLLHEVARGEDLDLVAGDFLVAVAHHTQQLVLRRTAGSLRRTNHQRSQDGVGLGGKDIIQHACKACQHEGKKVNVPITK